MGSEIERKFLVRDDSWRAGASGLELRQGYLSSVKERTVRVRTVGERGWITVKGVTRGIRRQEFEYEIPVADAREMLDALCERPLIEKVRYRITHASHTWEVDEFLGDNQGLVVAEVELADESVEVELPAWAGEEVSGDPRYFNSSLVKSPWPAWGRR
jgi:CYTH domain-containing protein